MRPGRSNSVDDAPDHFDEVTVDRPGSPKHKAAVLKDAGGSIAYPSFVPPAVQPPEPPAGPSGVNGTPRQLSDEHGFEGSTTSDSTATDEEAYEGEDERDDEVNDTASSVPPPRTSPSPGNLSRAQTSALGRRAPAVPTLDRAQTVTADPRASETTAVESPPMSPLGRVKSAVLGRHTSPPGARPPARRDWQTEKGKRTTARRPPAPRRAGTSHLNTALWQRHDEEYKSSTSSDEDRETVPAADRHAQAQVDRAKEGKEDHDVERKDAQLGGADADDRYRRFLVGNENYQSKGKVKKDGRLRITVDEKAGTGYIAKALGAAVHKMKSGKEPAGPEGATKVKSHESSKPAPPPTFSMDEINPRPKINIVIMVIGSRGDVQPFLKIGRILKDYGHRVRIATHPAFRDYVEKDSKLEFFSAGGDPSELMAFMVKNPGMIPTLETVRAGDIGKRRAAMAEMFGGFWRACINATDDEKDRQNLKMMGAKNPFVADAIIANPPCFAHIHCAEALGIPLHLMFTFPYTPTQAFPHPLASIKKSNVDPGYTNFISYPMVEMMIWQGLGDLVNAFRVKTLGLDPVSTLWAPGATYRMHVPFTYLWSPGLIPKPRDWGEEVDISGFVYLDLASTFTPPTDLEEFLAAGDMPIYIGFGSIVVDDADAFTQMIFKAVEKAGVRALVSRGWGGLGTQNTPDNVFMLDNTPHDWLFPRIKGCVIHGGAGTTAIALKLARPTMVVPFFGDQHFWGKMIYSSGVGPEPVPYKHLTADNLAQGIKYLLTEPAREAAAKIARCIEQEGDGAENAVKEFHRHLNLRGPNTMRCSLIPDQIAAWQPKRTHVKLSPLAADILVDAGLTSWRRLRLLRHQSWNDFEGPGEPVTGLAGSVTHTISRTFKGVGGVPVHMAKTTHKYRKRMSRKREKKKILAANARQNGTNGANGATTNGFVDPDGINGDQDIATADLEDALSPMRTTTRDIHEEFVGNVTTGVGMTASAIAMAPIDLSLALAQGFHNAPRLYGDDTVRKPLRITGIQSGLKAARKEFVYGVYDGFTGVVRLPVRGAKHNGAMGFVKGSGMGLMGLVVKNISAVLGPFGYALKGVKKQVERRKNPAKFVRRARIIQGQREALGYTDQELRKIEKQVVEGYHVMYDLCLAISAEEGRRGLAGQLDRVFVDTGALFEDVEVARRALRSLQRGGSLDDVVNSPTHDGTRSESETHKKGKKNGHKNNADANGLLSSGQNGHKSALGTKSLMWKKAKVDPENTTEVNAYV